MKKEKNEYALLVILATGLIIFLYALARIRVIMDFLYQVIERLPIESGFLVPLVKMLGITFLADYVCAICKEAGHASIANQIEIFAKLSIIALSIPELNYLLEVLDEFLA